MTTYLTVFLPLGKRFLTIYRTVFRKPEISTEATIFYERATAATAGSLEIGGIIRRR
ncbi:MAG: hypothetical protein Q7U22_14695 [Pararhizobium sp.]|nr:hypothetical protein [Pararhizobium sp.]